MVYAFSGAAQAITYVGWNFSHSGFGDENLAATDVAGATGFEQANWNNHSSNGQAPGTVPLSNLVNDAGVATTIDVVNWTQTANNSWHNGDSGTPNAKLIDGFANQQAAITFGDLGSEFTGGAGYSVVVYYNNNEGPSTSNLSVVGNGSDNVSRSITTGNTAGSSFSSVGFVEETGANAGSTNFTVFSGLKDSEFTVALAGANNNGISAIQIVGDLPPPPPAGSVGWNFSHGSFGDETLAPSDVAGAPGFEQANWNNHVSNGQAPGNTGLGLVDDLGGASGIEVVGWTQSANNSWHYDHGSSADEKLTGGFANQDAEIIFEGVNDFTEDGYTVVVYYGNNEFFVNADTSILVNGEMQNVQSADSLANVGYIMNMDDGLTDSTFAVFTNISGDILRVSLNSSQNDGISAIQIFKAVTVPEPTTGLCLLLSAVGLAARRRSRRHA